MSLLTKHIKITWFLKLKPTSILPCDSKKFRRLEGCEINSIRPIFKTEMFIYQSKVNLDGKILFGSIPRLTDPEIRKMLVKGMFGNNNSTFHSGP